MVIRDSHYVNGAARLGRRINTIRTNLNLPDVTREVANLMLRRVKDRFDSEVTPDNMPWKKLKDSTLRIKRQLGYGGAKKLVRTGELRDAIKIIRGGGSATYFNTGAGVRIGVQEPEKAKVAKIQNDGNKRIPARRFLGVGRLDVKAVDSLLRRKAQQAGLQA